MKRRLLFAVFLIGSVSAQRLEFVGNAYALDSDQLLYREVHQLTLNGTQPEREVVEYLDSQGELLARKTMRYLEPARPAFELRVLSPARSETVQPTAEGVEIASRDTGRVAWPQQPAVIDGGFHYFVLQHFDALLAGEAQDFQFLAPSRLRWIALTLEPIAMDEQQLVLQLQLQNAVLRWLVDPIELTYDVAHRRLLEYRGLTNLPTKEGGNYQARIRYQYEEAAS